MELTQRLRRSALIACGVALLTGVPARAVTTFTITPTFASNIMTDTNAAAIETTINNVIAIYEATFKDPITVFITFQEGGGLGGSNTSFFTVNWGGAGGYCAALKADGTSANDATANATLGSCAAGTNNPVTAQSTINVKSANLRAVGLSSGTVGSNAANPDGTITLNTSLTTPGSSGTTGQYSLAAVAEHEIDEVLGLGSGLCAAQPPGVCASSTTVQNPNGPFPEDLFRYTLGGARTYVAGASCSGLANNAYFSIDGGATQVNQFNQACNGGDFGDWIVHSPAQVQDWQSTIGSSPTLGAGEITALDVIGYTLAAPEPGTFVLVGTTLLAAGFLRRRVSSRKKN